MRIAAAADAASAGVGAAPSQLPFTAASSSSLPPPPAARQLLLCVSMLPPLLSPPPPPLSLFMPMPEDNRALLDVECAVAVVFERRKGGCRCCFRCCCCFCRCRRCCRWIQQRLWYDRQVVVVVLLLTILRLPLMPATLRTQQETSIHRIAALLCSASKQPLSLSLSLSLPCVSEIAGRRSWQEAP